MELNIYLRLMINNKIRPIYIKESCEACSSTENLHLHHIKLFSEIVDETLQYMNLPHQKLDEYDKKDLDMISCIVLGKHLLISYITLCEECHKNLHKMEKAKLCANNKHKQYYVNMRQKKDLERYIHIETKLLPYLESIMGNKLNKEMQKELIKVSDVKYNGKQQRSYRKINEGFMNSGIPYRIFPKHSNSIRYWKVERVDQK